MLCDHLSEHRMSNEKLSTGVAQGSVFGPFVLVQSRFPLEANHSSCRFYADDI